MGPYTLLVNRLNKLEVVDTREEIDMSNYIARTDTSLKKLITKGHRESYIDNPKLHEGGTFILTYIDNSILVVNPSNGDYVLPGYIHVSNSLENILSGYYGRRISNKATKYPLEGDILINQNILASRSTARIYSRYNVADFIDGWHIYSNSSDSRCKYVISDEGNGIKCRDIDGIVMMTQIVPVERISGITRLRIRCENAGIIMVGTEICNKEGDIWTWEGNPIIEDTNISIGVTHNGYVGRVEILND